MSGGQQLSYLDRFVANACLAAAGPAVVEAGRTIIHEEFASLVGRLAHALAHSEAGHKVLIHLPQTAEAFAAMFAVGLSGGFYATTNVAAPVERRRGTFAAFAPNIVVTNTEYAAEARAQSPSASIIN